MLFLFQDSLNSNSPIRRGIAARRLVMSRRDGAFEQTMSAASDSLRLFSFPSLCLGSIPGTMRLSKKRPTG